MNNKKENAITLIALVITIIVLLILTGVTIVTLTGENGLLNRASSAGDNTKRKAAEEKINLKITTVQMKCYAESQTIPTLQYLADEFYSDNEIEYVITKDEEVGNIEKTKITVGNHDIIYTKLTEYPYEFGIDNKLRLISIDNTIITPIGVIITVNTKNEATWVQDNTMGYEITGKIVAEEGEITETKIMVPTENGATEETLVLDEEGDFKYTVYKNGTYKIVAKSSENKIAEKEVKIDIKVDSTAPSLSDLTYVMDEMEITVTANAEDSESGIDRIEYSIKESENAEELNGNITSNKIILPKYGTYIITVTAYDKVGRSTAKTENFNETYQMNASSIIKGLDEHDVAGKVAITANNTTYNTNMILINNDLVLDGITQVNGATLDATNKIYEFGDAIEDPANETRDAQNSVILKVNGNLTIDSGVTLTACKNEQGYGGPKGLFIFVTGTITNNGKISMTARGARATGQYIYLWKNADGSYEFVPDQGAEGGESVTKKSSSAYYTYGKDGESGNLRRTGGGGSGGIYTNRNYRATSGAGGQGTSYSGGAGGGGANGPQGNTNGGNGSSIGGPGGNASCVSGGDTGGGAGNPGGTGSITSARGSDGTGGLLVIYANNIINNGNISSNGSRSNCTDVGGGSSGGGSVNIFANTIEKMGEQTADGEVRYGLSSRYGGAGGNGSVTAGTISLNDDSTFVKQ